MAVINVNGKALNHNADPRTPLLWVLREQLALTGTKYGCGIAQCGACTVLIDGQPRRSCITEVGEAAGKKITTIEGLAQNGRLHPVQEAFLEADAMQCGYCIPGMIMSAAGLLQKNPHPTEEEVLQAMHGNICRCGSYPRMVAAIRRAAGGSVARNPVAQKGGAR